jgi:hypothetical protein
MSDGRTARVYLAVPALGVEAGERLGEHLLQPGEEVPPERLRPADEVLPCAALRLVHPERGAARERRPLEGLVDLVLVEPVAELVHRREQAVEALLEVARRQPDVLDARAGRERVHGRVEPPRLLVVPEAPDHLELELLLELERERPRRRLRRRPRLGHLADERRLMLLEIVEEDAHLGRAHPALVVVEQRVVRLVVGAVEALDVAESQLEVPLQRRQERREVVVGARLDPHGDRERRRARDLGAEAGRHPGRLLEVVSRDPDQARLERVVLVLGRERLELLEQPAHLRGGELLVRDPAHGCELLGADGRTARRHHRLLVPAEDRARPRQVVDLGQTRPQLVEPLPHVRNRTRPPARGHTGCMRCK